MDIISLIGTVAAILTTASFLPQVLRIRRTKHTRDLSLPMYALFSFGVACWTLYGILTHSWPVIIANGVTLILAFYILIMKLKYG